MSRGLRALGATFLFSQLCGIGVGAAAPHWPFEFDPQLAAKSATVSQQIATGNATYPEMPVSRMVTMQSDQVTLYVWPEIAAMMQRIETAANAAPMTWPLTSTTCTGHVAFGAPPVLAANPSAACHAADTRIRTALADFGACADVEFPELYALAFNPANARDTSDDLVEMIGQAGQAWTHAPAPQVGLLPTDFVPTLRTILAKLRHGALMQHLATARAAYEQARTELTTNASCFDTGVAATAATQLQTMQAELDTAASYLAQLQTSGTAASAQEGVCLAANARVRPTLSYPSLTRAEREFIAFWIGGTYWRMRGGGLIPLGSTQDARTYFVTKAFGVIGRLLGGDDGADVSPRLYLPLVLQGWGEWMDMGTTQGGDDRYSDLVGMTKRGEYQVNGAVSALKGKGYDTLDLTVSGLMMGPGYFRGYYPNASFRYAAQLQPQPPYSDGISGPTAIGEFSFGASLGLGLAHTLLAGKPSGQPAVALCVNAVCGDDGCGGSCGTCGDGMMCGAGQCIATQPDAGVSGGGDAGNDLDDPNGATGDQAGGCCQSSGGGAFGSALFALLGVVLLRRRR